MITVNGKGQAQRIPTQRVTGLTYKAKRGGLTKGAKLVLKIIAGVLLSLIMIGIGHEQGLKDAGHTPDGTTMSILHYAQSMGAKNCRAEWHTARELDQPTGLYEVVCDKPLQITNLDADHDPQR